MADGTTIYLKDYTPPAWRVAEVSLTFRLHPTACRVLSRIQFTPGTDAPGPLVLDGEHMRLISARIDGAEVRPEVSDAGLTCPAPQRAFVWEAEVEIAPEQNTALEGLYMSNGMYCTQCEAEGFRRITYYPDRPDVMAPFTVRIEGDAPVLLSNGNLTASGSGWAEWHDPWPKPSYLFALVAGELTAHRDHFTTRSGNHVDLALWVRPGDEGKCAFGMDALKRSMAWDEEVYGREYDLDQFNIVAVDDFNAGAMENKGLNIFNSAAVLCSPETATDADFERIEAIIAHEYFHNWTGNRITCRDWFQLCLKEGLTVFRDQQFTGDMRGHAVKRIRDAIDLRAYQFKEDGGPLAHPVRPESFVEINNFYTATVYEKGAEVIGMLRRIVGPEGYAKALDLYFERHDGDAATIEDWLKVFEDATGADLSQFSRWYAQAGTPHVTIDESYAGGTLTLSLSQETPPTPGQPTKSPLHIPVDIALFGENGAQISAQMVHLTEAQQSVAFTGLPSRPVVSALRGFSAPVVLNHNRPLTDHAFLLAHDTDAFNAWDSGQIFARDQLLAMIRSGAEPSEDFLAALTTAASDTRRDPALRALLLDLPREEALARHIHGAGETPDPGAIHSARQSLRRAIASRANAALARLYEQQRVTAPYEPGAEQAGKRALANAALGYLSETDGGVLAQAQFDSADNMTQSLAALAALARIGAADAALAAFEQRWRDDRLVMNKWFALQVASAAPEEAVAVAERLAAHPQFDWKNPNRFRAVFASFAMNQAGFHRADGAGYRLLGSWLARLDSVNPQVAARTTSAFQTMPMWDDARKSHMKEVLDGLSSREGLSGDTAEMVARMRAG